MDAIFCKATDLYEINTRSQFTPQFSGFNSVVQAVYNQYVAHQLDTSKSLSLGMLTYYAAAISWLRMLRIKQVNGDSLSRTERDILATMEEIPLSLPQPLSVYLKAFGNITSPTQENLFPHFLEFPESDDHAHWGMIDLQNHTKYENYPALGIAAELLMKESDPTVNPGAWRPSVIPADTSPTEALLCYVPILHVRPEVRNSLQINGITASRFTTVVPKADFNLRILLATSNAIDRLGTFKVEKTTFQTMAPSGHSAQLVRLHPTPFPNSPIVDTKLQPYCFSKDGAGSVGMALTYVFFIHKEGDLASGKYTSWCALENNPNKQVVTQAWIDNRNAICDIPPQYSVTPFTTGARTRRTNPR